MHHPTKHLTLVVAGTLLLLPLLPVAGAAAADVDHARLVLKCVLGGSQADGAGASCDDAYDDGVADGPDMATPLPVLAEPLIENPTVRTAFDGTTFTVNYPSSPLAPTIGVDAIDIGREAAQAGVDAYNTMVLRNVKGCGTQDNPNPSNWGFTTMDLDCDIPVMTRGTEAATCRVTIYGGSENPQLVVPFDTVECLRAFGYYQQGTASQILRIAVAHEFFHHLQYVMGFPAPWVVVVESPARLIQTLVEPDLENQSSSLWYAGGNSGANGFQANPTKALCARTYDFASFWGFLYAQDGGIAGLRHVLDSVPPFSNQPCNDALPAAITAGLSTLSVPHEHDTFQEILSDFAVAVYTKDFSWGTPDGGAARNWGLFLNDVKREIQLEGTTGRSVGAWGLQYVRLPADSVYDVAVTDADGLWQHRLFLADANGGLTIQDIGAEPFEIDGSQYAEVVVQTARLAAATGTYELTTIEA